MSAERVSCVIPAHDAEAHLREAIDSALAQTRPPFEVIVVDDASTDATCAIAEAYGPPVRVVVLPDNRGAPAARNAGVAAARGELVAFLDADDLWTPEKLEAQLEQLRADPSLDGSTCEIENFWEPGLEAEEERWRRHGRVRGRFLFGTLMARRELLLRVPLDPVVTHGDHADWVLRAREAGATFGVLPRVLAFRRRHATNATRGGDAFEPYFALLKRRLDQRRGA